MVPRERCVVAGMVPCRPLSPRWRLAAAQMPGLFNWRGEEQQKSIEEIKGNDMTWWTKVGIFFFFLLFQYFKEKKIKFKIKSFTWQDGIQPIGRVFGSQRVALVLSGSQWWRIWAEGGRRESLLLGFPDLPTLPSLFVLVEPVRIGPVLSQFNLKKSSYGGFGPRRWPKSASKKEAERPSRMPAYGKVVGQVKK